MSFGRNIKVNIFGESHSPEIVAEISGLPINIDVDSDLAESMLKRRSGEGLGEFSEFVTERKEKDEVVYSKRLGGTLEAHILNKNYDSKDYDTSVIRPGHADFTSWAKEGRIAPGGGRFSGRMTVGLVAISVPVIQILNEKGIEIKAEVLSISGEESKEKQLELLKKAKEEGDSLGGIVRVTVSGVTPGAIGDSTFDGIESRISEAIFGVPAVKGIAFGSGFRGTKLKGSENNDQFYIEHKGEKAEIKTRTNNAGGILGGISNGMPITFEVAFKPTPTISIAQSSVNVESMQEVELEYKGRHDTALVLRTPVILEAVTALAIYDLMLDIDDGIEVELTADEELLSLRNRIDELDQKLALNFEERLKVASRIGELKEKLGKPITDSDREEEVLNESVSYMDPKYRNHGLEFFKKTIELSKDVQKKPFGILGRSLSHSYSPEVHKLISEVTGSYYEYIKFEKEPEELEDFIINGNWSGLNVTIPYKEVVTKYCTELTEEAQKVGAVNTLIKRGNMIVGHNSDYVGFKNTLEYYDISVTGKKAIVLGTGGASKAVIAVLLDMGIDRIYVASRDPINANKVDSPNVEYISYDEIIRKQDAYILVNTTPVGTYPSHGESLVYPGGFIRLEYAIDLVYNPYRTNLLVQAKKSLIEPISGLRMLVSQAINSAMFFLGKPISSLVIEEVEARIRYENQNIVLIGMPGSGKTTIGKLISEKSGKEFIDTDKLITQKAGKTPEEILKTEGEDAFRDKEAEVIYELRNLKNVVIATGGGVITREENYYSLAENGKFVFLNRELMSLAVEGRPLSESIGLERLYNYRLPMYRAWADEEIDISGMSPEEVAAMLY